MTDTCVIEMGVHTHVSGPQSGWPTNRTAVEVVHHALDNGEVVSLDQYTTGGCNRDLVITLTVRHRHTRATGSKPPLSPPPPPPAPSRS